jgi:hypothetical protein
LAESSISGGTFTNVAILNSTITNSTVVDSTMEGRVVYTESGNPTPGPTQSVHVTTTDQSSVQTTDGSTVAFVFPKGDIPLADETNTRIHLVIQVQDKTVGGTANAASYEMLYSVSRHGAAAPVAMLGTNPTIIESDGTNAGAPPAGFTAPTVVAVNTVGTTWVARIEVTGEVGHTLNHGVMAEWQTQT